MTKPRLLFTWLLLWAIVCLTGREPVSGQLPTDRSTEVYLEELERRQLFGSIIRHCESQFDNSQLPGGLRAQLAARWIRALTLQALNLDPQSAGQVWPQVRRTAERLVAETQFFPQHALVRFQVSLIGLGEARLASLLPATEGDRAQQREWGLQAIRQATESLRQLQQELGQLASTVPERPLGREPYPELTRGQLQALARDVEYQLLAALAVRTRFYGAEDLASRLDTYQQMLALGEVLQPKLSDESSVWWETHYLVLEALRGLEDWSRWDGKWDNTPLPLAPNQVLGKITAARLEMLLDRQDFPAAIRQAEDFLVLLRKRDPRGLNEIQSMADLDRSTAWPEFDVVRGRLYLALAAEADRLATESQGQVSTLARTGAEAQILEFSRTLTAQHGGFWSGELNRRLLGGVTTGATQGPVSLLLIRQAMTDGHWELVQQLTQKGVQQAAESGNAALAMELSTLVAGAAKWVAPEAWMVREIEAATLVFSSHVDAARNHHYACILAAQIATRDPRFAEVAQTVWRRHSSTWPQSESAHRVRLQLAAVAAQARQYAAAAEVLLDIDAASPSFPTAVEQLSSALTGLLFDPSLSTGQRAELADLWVARLRPKLQEGNGWIGQWSPELQRLALLLIQVQLESAEPQATWVVGLLRTLQQRAPEFDARLLSRFSCVAVAVEYHQPSGETEALGQLIAQPDAILSADFLWLIQTMSYRLPKLGLAGELEASLTAHRSGMIRRAAAVQIAALDGQQQVSRESTDQYSDWLNLQRLTALLCLDRLPEALQLALAVAEEHPNSLPHQQWLGYCLSRSNNPADLVAAKNRWRMIGFLTTEGSEPWFEAKYYLADVFRRQGKSQEASDLLRFLKLTKARAWEASIHRDKLERLLKSISS